MAKLSNTNKKFDSTNLLLLIGVAVIFITFVAASIILIAKPGQIKRIDQIKEITISEYTKLATEENEEYFVLVYSSETNDNYKYSTYRNELIEQAVLEYANHAKKHEGHAPIYVLDLSKDVNSGAIATLGLSDEADVPALIKMKLSGTTSTVNRRYKTVSEINDALNQLKH